MRLPILLATLTSVIFGAPAPADASPPHAAPGARAAVEACLKLVRELTEALTRSDHSLELGFHSSLACDLKTA